jgi:hypothetical protein
MTAAPAAAAMAPAPLPPTAGARSVAFVNVVFERASRRAARAENGTKVRPCVDTCAKAHGPPAFAQYSVRAYPLLYLSHSACTQFVTSSCSA